MSQTDERGFDAAELEQPGPVRDSHRTTAEGRTPRVIDPGEGGWADEPKGITPAEELLYGDLAGAVRCLGQTAIAAGDAYSLVCKHFNMHEQDVKIDPEFEPDPAYGEAVQATWQLYDNARGVYREVAAKAAALARRRKRGVSRDEPRVVARGEAVHAGPPGAPDEPY